MNAYNKYMDNISVSGALHCQLIAHTAVRPSCRLNAIKRYAAAFACLTVIILGAWLLQNNVVLSPGGTTPISQSDTDPSAAYAADEYELIFNKGGSPVANEIYIPGHFWQGLTEDDLQKVFPALTDMYTITATANFRSDETGAALFNINAHAVSAGGLASYIQIAPGKAVIDYVLDGDNKTSDVFGTAVTAGYFETKPNSRGQRNVVYFASFKRSGLGYYVELGGGESESAVLRDEFSSLIGLLIKGGIPDLSIFDHPVIPELRQDTLDLNEAYADPDFGAYLPQNIPSGFAFESAERFINQESDYLSALWTKGMGDIHWNVSLLEEDDMVRLTSVADTQNYDLVLYPIPRGESVPRELREIVDDPIFRIEDLTLETVQARAYEASDTGDIAGPRMRFGVLYEDTLVEINTKGLTPEELLSMLQQIKK